MIVSQHCGTHILCQLTSQTYRKVLGVPYHIPFLLLFQFNVIVDSFFPLKMERLECFEIFESFSALLIFCLFFFFFASSSVLLTLIPSKGVPGVSYKSLWCLHRSDHAYQMMQ